MCGASHCEACGISAAMCTIERLLRRTGVDHNEFEAERKPVDVPHDIGERETASNLAWQNLFDDLFGLQIARDRGR